MPEYSRPPVFPVIMVAAGVVLILGAMFWSMSLGKSQDVGLAVSPTQVGVDRAGITPRVPLVEVKRVSLEEAKAAFDNQEAIFIDTRGDPYFSDGHIPGAISMVVNEVNERLDELDRSRWIITYCT